MYQSQTENQSNKESIHPPLERKDIQILGLENKKYSRTFNSISQWAVRCT